MTGGLLRATEVTQGWNGYQNKSQHGKLTLEKKILQQGFEPATFRSWVRRSNHWAIPTPWDWMFGLNLSQDMLPAKCFLSLVYFDTISSAMLIVLCSALIHILMSGVLIPPLVVLWTAIDPLILSHFLSHTNSNSKQFLNFINNPGDWEAWSTNILI